MSRELEVQTTLGTYETVYEILPWVFYRGAPKRHLDIEDLSFETVVDAYEWVPSPQSQLTEFEIDDSQVPLLYERLARELKFDSRSCLGHDKSDDKFYLFALLAAATQRDGRNSLGLDQFEDSRQLFLDVQFAQFLDVDFAEDSCKFGDVEEGELAASLLYYSLFGDPTGFYRSVRADDLANWGLAGNGLNIIKFFEDSATKCFPSSGGRRPSLAQRREKFTKASELPDYGQSEFDDELEYLRLISTNPSARLIELLSMSQFLRANWLIRDDFFEQTRITAQKVLLLTPEEESAFFYSEGMWSVKVPTEFGEWSNELAAAKAFANNVSVWFGRLPGLKDVHQIAIDHMDQLNYSVDSNPNSYNASSLLFASIIIRDRMLTGVPDNGNYFIFDFGKRWKQNLEFIEARRANILYFTTPTWQGFSLADDMSLVTAAQRIAHANLERFVAAERIGSFSWMMAMSEKLSDFEILTTAIICLDRIKSLDDKEAVRNLRGVYSYLDFEIFNRLFSPQQSFSATAAGRNLISSFATHGLDVPAVPAWLVKSLMQQSDWQWGTERNHDFFEDYEFEPFIRENKSDAGQDHFYLGHSGHAINSYALTLAIKFSGIFIAAQVPWGGAMSDHLKDSLEWNEMIKTLNSLFSSPVLTKADPWEPPTYSKLKYVLLFSSFRGFCEVRNFQDGIATPHTTLSEAVKDLFDRLVNDEIDEF